MATSSAKKAKTCKVAPEKVNERYEQEEVEIWRPLQVKIKEAMRKHDFARAKLLEHEYYLERGYWMGIFEDTVEYDYNLPDFDYRRTQGRDALLAQIKELMDDEQLVHELKKRHWTRSRFIAAALRFLSSEGKRIKLGLELSLACITHVAIFPTTHDHWTPPGFDVKTFLKYCTQELLKVIDEQQKKGHKKKLEEYDKQEKLFAMVMDAIDPSQLDEIQKMADELKPGQ